MFYGSVLFDYDVIIKGPGGEALQCKRLKRVFVPLVEKEHFVGGSCTHLGTIPSKSLRHTVHRLTTFMNDPLFATDQMKELTFECF